MIKSYPALRMLPSPRNVMRPDGHEHWVLENDGGEDENEKDREKSRCVDSLGGYEVISITASCWHVRKPTTETIALWRRHGWKSLFEEKARKLKLSVELRPPLNMKRKRNQKIEN